MEVGAGRGGALLRVLDRRVPLNTEQSRVFDIRLQRAETIAIDSQLELFFDATSQSPVQIVSIRLFGLSRSVFGWPQQCFELVEPLSLPDSFAAALFRAFVQLARRNLFLKVRGP